MRILTNVFAFLLLIAGVVLFVMVLVPSWSSVPTNQQLVKKDVPLPDELHPKVEEAMDKLVKRAEDKGIDVAITDGHRSKEEQKELYEKGRSKDGQIVTNAKAGESYHNYGMAIDFALRLDNGNVVWDRERDDNGNGEADWMEVVSIAKDLGFEWGGDWSSFKDYPHLQMDFGLTIRELQYGKRPQNITYAEETNEDNAS